MITEELSIDRERALSARALRIRRREARSNIIISNTENNIVNTEFNNIENNMEDNALNNEMVNQPIEENPLLALAGENQLEQVLAMVQQLQQQQSVLINQITDANLQIQQLKDANPPNIVVEPEVQQLVGEDPAYVLKNSVGDVVKVEERFFIRPPPANSISEIVKANLKVPTLVKKDLLMSPNDWLDYAAKLANYYNIGGEVSVTTFWDPKVLSVLCKTFKLTVADFVQLTKQRQVYQFLKVFWKKPVDNTNDLISAIKGVALHPAEKGTMVVCTNLFVVEMETVIPEGLFTKALLDTVRNQVYIREWMGHFKLETYDSFRRFYDHLERLAKEYDDSTQPVKALSSTKNQKEKNDKNEKNEKEEKDSARDRTPKEGGKCLLCSGNHYAFALTNDYDKDYGDHVTWECPQHATYSPQLKKNAWEERRKQHVRNKKRAWDKKKGGGSGGAKGATGSTP